MHHYKSLESIIGGSAARLHNKSKVSPRAIWRRDNTVYHVSGLEKSTEPPTQPLRCYKLFLRFLLNLHSDNSEVS